MSHCSDPGGESRRFGHFIYSNTHLYKINVSTPDGRPTSEYRNSFKKLWETFYGDFESRARQFVNEQDASDVAADMMMRALDQARRGEFHFDSIAKRQQLAHDAARAFRVAAQRHKKQESFASAHEHIQRNVEGALPTWLRPLRNLLISTHRTWIYLTMSHARSERAYGFQTRLATRWYSPALPSARLARSGASLLELHEEVWRLVEWGSKLQGDTSPSGLLREIDQTLDALDIGEDDAIHTLIVGVLRRREGSPWESSFPRIRAAVDRVAALAADDDSTLTLAAGAAALGRALDGEWTNADVEILTPHLSRLASEFQDGGRVETGVEAMLRWFDSGCADAAAHGPRTEEEDKAPDENAAPGRARRYRFENFDRRPNDHSVVPDVAGRIHSKLLICNGVEDARREFLAAVPAPERLAKHHVGFLRSAQQILEKQSEEVAIFEVGTTLHDASAVAKTLTSWLQDPTTAPLRWDDSPGRSREIAGTALFLSFMQWLADDAIPCNDPPVDRRAVRP